MVLHEEANRLPLVAREVEAAMNLVEHARADFGVTVKVHAVVGIRSRRDFSDVVEECRPPHERAAHRLSHDLLRVSPHVLVLAPGLSGPPDSGTILTIPPGGPTAGGMPLAMVGSLCLMVNSVWGFPYTLPIGPLSPSQIRIAGQPLVRIGDMIPSGPGILSIVGPPASPLIMDSSG